MLKTPTPLLTFSLNTNENKIEQKILHVYFKNPQNFIAPEDYERYWLSWGNALPNGLKITKHCLDEFDNKLKRFFILPGEKKEDTVSIPFKRHCTGDSGLHAGEMINGNFLLFHQNANDLAKIQEDDSNSEEEEETHALSPEEQEQRDRYKAFNRECYQSKNYLKIGQSHNYEFTVKWLTMSDNQRYVLKRRLLYPDEPCHSVEHCLPSLYLCNSFIRNGKRYEVMYDKGPTLNIFLNQKNTSLTVTQRDYIAECLIKKLAQLQATGIVLTDIKDQNICIKEHLDPLNPYTLRFIDDNEAFQGSNTGQGCGTVGYLAPEFFNDPPLLDSFLTFQSWQEALQISSALNAALKIDRRQLFCQATDTFALGCVLLRDLNLSSHSRFYILAKAMCAIDPQDRPNLTTLFTGESLLTLKK